MYDTLPSPRRLRVIAAARLAVQAGRVVASPAAGVWAAWGRAMHPAERLLLAASLALTLAAVAVVAFTPSIEITTEGGPRTASIDTPSPLGPPPGGHLGEP